MYDSDSDGRITLEEYRNVKYAPLPVGLRPPPVPLLVKDPGSPLSRPAPQVVEELLSGNPHIEKESARSIADGAMMEAASVCVGQMVSWGSQAPPALSPTPCPAVVCFWKAPEADPTPVLCTTLTGPGIRGRRPHCVDSQAGRKLPAQGQAVCTPWKEKAPAGPRRDVGG